ncbi:MAG: alpha/beta fold hydrolase [Candidatus Zixiibacteriota bacterium]
MPYAQLDNICLHYEEHGHGEPLLFLHGFTLDHRMWQPQVAFFSDAYRVILLDSRGHGLSDAPATGYSRPERVKEILKFLDYLRIDHVHLIGLSMGGSLGMGVAFEHQDRLKSLTLVSTGAAGYDIGKKFSRLDTIAKEKGIEVVKREWLRVIESWYGHELSDVKELMVTMINDHTGAIWSDPMRGKYPPSPPDVDDAHKITVPTCIFSGLEDKVFVPLARLLHERIKGSVLHEYEGVGHMLNLEASERFNRDLAAFLSGLSSR